MDLKASINNPYRLRKLNTMSNTKDVSEIWWECKTALERFELMKKFGIKKYSRKAIRKMYDETFKSSNLSIQFAEWLSQNEWVKRTATHPNKVGQYYSHKHCEYKTIEQLFDIFSGVA